MGSTFSGTHSLAAILRVILQPANTCLNKIQESSVSCPLNKRQQCNLAIKQTNSTLGCRSCSIVGQGRRPFLFAQYFWDDICSAVPSLGLPSVRGALKVQQKHTRMVREMEHTMWEKGEREFCCSGRRDTLLHSPTTQKVQSRWRQPVLGDAQQMGRGNRHKEQQGKLLVAGDKKDLQSG